MNLGCDVDARTLLHDQMKVGDAAGLFTMSAAQGWTCVYILQLHRLICKLTLRRICSGKYLQSPLTRAINGLYIKVNITF